jgi:hypothetical protein
MAEASYDKQFLAVQAAGFISADGATQFGFGCNMTRVGTGDYALVLDASAGVVDDDSFLQIQVKGGNLPRVATANDISNTVKQILTFNDADIATDTEIEVALFKSVSR